MATQQFKNNARTTLGGSGLANTATVGDTFSVATGDGTMFPAGGSGDYFDVTFQDSTYIEIIRVSARASDVFTIMERARESTTARTWASGTTIVALRLTAAAVEAIVNHAADSADAHAASAITNTPAGNLAATTVQAALDELQTDIDTRATSAALTAHTGDTTDAHAASAITNTPAGNIVATTVQAAINELDTDKQAAHANLTAEAGLTGAADKLAYYTGVGAKALTSLSAFARSLLDDSDAAAMLATLGASTLTALDVWPVGSVYTSVAATDPGTLFGGTWVSFGAGRVLVGIDATQTEFDTVEETGGAKTHTLTTAEMPSHTHSYTATTGTSGNAGGGTSGYLASSSTTGASGGGGAHNNLQPYIVVYFWKRTA